MKILVLWMFGFFFQSSAVNLEEIRNRFYTAADDQGKSHEFHHYIHRSFGEEKAIITGYRGMSYMLKAKFSWNPFIKWNYFLKGRDLLEKAINENPEYVELRFLRYCIQMNAPFFLNYARDIPEDKAFLLKQWQYIDDEDLKHKVKDFMLTFGECNKEEREYLEM